MYKILGVGVVAVACIVIYVSIAYPDTVVYSYDKYQSCLPYSLETVSDHYPNCEDFAEQKDIGRCYEIVNSTCLSSVDLHRKNLYETGYEIRDYKMEVQPSPEMTLIITIGLLSFWIALIYGIITFCGEICPGI